MTRFHWTIGLLALLVAVTALTARAVDPAKPAEPAPAGPTATAQPADPVKPAVAGVENGAKAPTFSLPDVDGKIHSLAEAAGKWVVLEWTNYDCPFVRKHYDSGNMQDLQRTYTEKGVIWWSICSSAPGKQGHLPPGTWKERMAAQKVAATAVLLDPTGEVGRLYEAKTTPQLFVINPEGVVVYQGAIDSIRSTDPADVAKAVPHIRQVLEAGLAGKPIPEPTRTIPYGCSVKY